MLCPHLQLRILERQPYLGQTVHTSYALDASVEDAARCLQVLRHCQSELDIPRESERLGVEPSTAEAFFERHRHLPIWSVEETDDRREAYAHAIGKRDVAARLADLVVLVIGLGGVGGNAAYGLARLGVGTLLLMDDDIVELSNLSKSYAFGPSDIGQPKAESLARRIHVDTPSTKARAWSMRPKVGAALVPSPSLVLACFDEDYERTLDSLTSLGIHDDVPIVTAGCVEDVVTIGPSLSLNELRKHAQQVLPVGCYSSPEVRAFNESVLNIGTFGAVTIAAGALVNEVLHYALTGALPALAKQIQIHLPSLNITTAHLSD